jgi:nucleotide-binding universal stress UspA family protein
MNQKRISPEKACPRERFERIMRPGRDREKLLGGGKKRKGGPMKLFKRIIMATDLSPASEPALKEAIGLAKENGAELLIAHVYQPPSVVEAQSISAGVYEEWDQNIRAEVKGRLQELVENAAKEGVKAEPLILTGAPYEAIAEAARGNDADLVVMGTHGRKGVSRFFLGSVAARVISTAPCPVMTVRAA